MNGFQKSSTDTKEKIRLLKVKGRKKSLTFDFRNCILQFSLEIMTIYRNTSIHGRSRRKAVHVGSVTYKIYWHEFGTGLYIGVSNETVKFIPSKHFVE